MFTTSTTVFKLVERYDVPEALGNPPRSRLTTISPNEFLKEAFDEWDAAPTRKAITFIDELRSELVYRAQRS